MKKTKIGNRHEKHIENNLEHFSTFEFVMEIVDPVVPVYTLIHNTNSGNINLSFIYSFPVSDPLLSTFCITIT